MRFFTKLVFSLGLVCFFLVSSNIARADENEDLRTEVALMRAELAELKQGRMPQSKVQPLQNDVNQEVQNLEQGYGTYGGCGTSLNGWYSDTGVASNYVGSYQQSGFSGGCGTCTSGLSGGFFHLGISFFSGGGGRNYYPLQPRILPVLPGRQLAYVEPRGLHAIEHVGPHTVQRDGPKPISPKTEIGKISPLGSHPIGPEPIKAIHPSGDIKTSHPSPIYPLTPGPKEKIVPQPIHRIDPNTLHRISPPELGGTHPLGAHSVQPKPTSVPLNPPGQILKAEPNGLGNIRSMGTGTIQPINHGLGGISPQGPMQISPSHNLGNSVPSGIGTIQPYKLNTVDGGRNFGTIQPPSYRPNLQTQNIHQIQPRNLATTMPSSNSSFGRVMPSGGGVRSMPSPRNFGGGGGIKMSGRR